MSTGKNGQNPNTGSQSLSPSRNSKDDDSGKSTKGDINNNGDRPKTPIHAYASPPIAYAGPQQIVYEGSEVRLEGSCNLDVNIESKDSGNVSYFWSLNNSESNSNLSFTNNDIIGTNTKNPKFKAPYVPFDPKNKDNKPYISLSFKLVVKDNSTGLISEPSTVDIVVKMIQRALVLQGGGSLGAYELGVYKALCEKLIQNQDKDDNKRKNRPLFDVIAGSSIGAINASLIVSSVLKSMRNGVGSTENLEINKIWQKSVEDLENYWNDITFPIPVLENGIFDNWWDFWNSTSKGWINIYKRYFSPYTLPLNLQHNFFNPLYLFTHPEMYTPTADSESARRYFSWLLLPYFFPNNVVTPNFLQPDKKFLAGIPQFTRFDNMPLAKIAKEKGYWITEMSQ